MAGETSVIRAIIADTGDGAAGSAGKIWTIKVDIRSCLNMVITAPANTVQRKTVK